MQTLTTPFKPRTPIINDNFQVLNKEIPAHKLISHKVPMSQTSQAYDLFSNAARHQTLKVLLENDLN